MYSLEVSGSVKKFLAKRTPKEQLTVIRAFEILQKDPFNNTLDNKPFKSTNGNEYRLRIRDDRFVYRIINDNVII